VIYTVIQNNGIEKRESHFQTLKVCKKSKSQHNLKILENFIKDIYRDHFWKIIVFLEKRRKTYEAFCS
jgi:hypothetical protein